MNSSLLNSLAALSDSVLVSVNKTTCSVQRFGHKTSHSYNIWPIQWHNSAVERDGAPQLHNRGDKEDLLLA